MITVRRLLGIVLVGAVGALASTPAFALDPYDVPVITCEGSTLSSITLHVCGGATTGAPAGVTIQWKTAADYAATGWADDGTLCKLSLSGQPSLQHPGKSNWELLPGECYDIGIGDINFDETGVSGTGCGLDALECGTDYVFRWFAHAGRGFGRSDWGGTLTCATLACVTDRCTYTQGYWKTHGTGACQTGQNADEWPASVRSGGMSLGTVPYTADQLCSILNTPAAGNGLLTLAHQLITAKMNLANNGPTCTDVSAAIAAADALIGSKIAPPVGTGSLKPGATSDLVSTLTAYNEGTLCGPHCGDEGSNAAKQGSTPSATTPVQKSTWGKLKISHR